MNGNSLMSIVRWLNGIKTKIKEYAKITQKAIDLLNEKSKIHS